MEQSDIETVYETVAKSIDAVGREDAELFLAKLVLLPSNELNDLRKVIAIVEKARLQI